VRADPAKEYELMRLIVTCAHCGEKFEAVVPPPAEKAQYFSTLRVREVSVTCTHCEKENKVKVPK
jgi:hypothetical protein